MQKFASLRWLFILAVLLALGGGAWFMLQARQENTVEAAHPTRGPAVQAVYATGTVEATVMMPIAPRVSARLMELNVDEGSEVRKDQVLARLEDEDVKGSLKELQAREEFTRREYERNTTLVRQNAVSRAEADRSRADWDAARAAVRAARAQLSYMTLLAPADGRIIRRDGEIGQLIPVNQPVFWLSCCAPLRISSEVDEEDISLVQPGQKVLIRADAFPDRMFNGEVLAITPKGDPVARSYRVRVGFTEENPLLIGMTAETNIVARETQDAMLVPTAAVSEGQVWLVRDGKLARQKVTLGAKGQELTEITAGLSMEDLVVTKSAPAMKEGEAVHVQPAAGNE